VITKEQRKFDFTKNVTRIVGCVRESLINSEKASMSPKFENNTERFFCLRFSITCAHYRIVYVSFDAKKTLGKTTTTAEMLKERKIGGSTFLSLSFYFSSTVDPKPLRGNRCAGLSRL